MTPRRITSSKEASKRPPPRREPTLGEREDARNAAFFKAWAAHQRRPTRLTLERLAKARAARGGHITEQTRNDREQYLLHLLVVHGDRGVEVFAEELGISLRAAREWRTKALADRRPTIEAARGYAFHRLDGVATLAIQTGDMGAAARAIAQAAKFLGVTEKIEVDHNVTGSVSIETQKALSPIEQLDPALFVAAFLHGTIPSAQEVQRMNEDKPRYLAAIEAAKHAFAAVVCAPQIPAIERKHP